MEVNAEETNDEEENNVSEPDPEPEAKDLQETLKRRMKRRRTDAEPPPLTKTKNHRATKEIRTEHAATVKRCRKKK